MHSSYFVLKNKEGKQAEQLVKDYLTDRGYTVQDVSEEQDNYQNDIDFIVQKDGRTSKIEVKLDTRLAETQNICFVLITGYFMCTSHITKQKFCKLLGEYYFYTIGIWAVFLLTGYEVFSVKDLLQVLFPFFSVSNGFTSCFLLFYLLIPFLNKMIHALTQQEHFLLMMWCLCVYVVLPSFAKAEVTFNYVTWFSILYIIAAYLRLYPQSWFESSRITGMIALVCLILSWWSVVILAWLSRLAEKGIWLSYFFVSDSNKVLALATGGSLFLFFRSLKLGYSKCINTIAASTFGVLMIHANSDTMRRWLWRDVCNNVGAYTVGNVVPHAVVCVVIIYAVCTLIDMGRIWLLRHIRFGIKS